MVSDRRSEVGARRVAVAYWRDGGVYPRVRKGGDGDPYLRAATVMAATLARFAPDVRVEIHSNLRPDDPELSPLRRIGASIISTPFEHRMPDGYFHKFTASTYAIDVLGALGRSLGAGETGLLIDPDVVWVRDPGPLFEQADRSDLIAYPIPYPPDFVDLGLTRRGLSEVIAELTGKPLRDPNGLVAHLGGELLGGTRLGLSRFAEACGEAWTSSIARFETGTAPWLHTEEHVYSAAFHALGHGAEETTMALRRVWTRPGRLRNVRGDDDDRIAWHVLSEKERGLTRMYSAYIRGIGPFEPGISDDEYRRRAAGALSIRPSVLDRASFSANRLYARIRGKRLGPMPA